jgi:hydroxymethylbilane synthase
MSGPPHIRLGSRGSPLALWQARFVAARLREGSPTTAVEIVQITTSGDQFQEVSLKDRGGKGLFVKEIEDQLLAGRIDLAVHSVKDVPGHLPRGLQLTAVLERADPRDAFLSQVATTVMDLPPKARVGTSSPRRMAQMKRLRPDLQLVEFRGNVETRIHKMEAGQVDATVLAVAGLERLGLTEHICSLFEIKDMIPAIGQGAIGIETRTDATALNTWLREQVNHDDTGRCVAAERALLAAIDGDCHTPVAAHAQLRGGQLHLWACLATEDGGHLVRVESTGSPTSPELLGEHVARELECQL